VSDYLYDDPPRRSLLPLFLIMGGVSAVFLLCGGMLFLAGAPSKPRPIGPGAGATEEEAVQRRREGLAEERRRAAEAASPERAPVPKAEEDEAARNALEGSMAAFEELNGHLEQMAAEEAAKKAPVPKAAEEAAKKAPAPIPFRKQWVRMGPGIPLGTIDTTNAPKVNAGGIYYTHSNLGPGAQLPPWAAAEEAAYWKWAAAEEAKKKAASPEAREAAKVAAERGGR
jgi:hypothetical protein